MKKKEFILTVLANNLNVFTNVQARRANIVDMIQAAEGMFQIAEAELEKMESTKPEKLSRVATR